MKVQFKILYLISKNMKFLFHYMKNKIKLKAKGMIPRWIKRKKLIKNKIILLNLLMKKFRNKIFFFQTKFNKIKIIMKFLINNKKIINNKFHKSKFLKIFTLTKTIKILFKKMK